MKTFWKIFWPFVVSISGLLYLLYVIKLGLSVIYGVSISALGIFITIWLAQLMFTNALAKKEIKLEDVVSHSFSVIVGAGICHLAIIFGF